jgi:hypothetical protein
LWAAPVGGGRVGGGRLRLPLSLPAPGAAEAPGPGRPEAVASAIAERPLTREGRPR